VTRHTSAETTDQRMRRRRRFGAILLAAALALSAGLTKALASVLPAQAAAIPGSGGHWTPAGGWLGNYVAGGQRVYCIDVLTDTSGSGGQGQLSDAITEGGHGTRPVSGDELRMINYAVSEWGQTDDPIVAAAVGAFVYNFTSANWAGEGEHYIRGPHADAIREAYGRVKADSEANFDRSGGTGSGTLRLTIDPSNHYLGTLEITGLSPADAIGTVTLTNAVFADTGLPSREGVRNNSSFAITGVPPAAEPYRVAATAEFTGNGGTVYEPNITVYSEGSMQRTVGPGTSRTEQIRFSLEATDETDRSVEFSPVVGTKVSAKYVDLGEEFVDVLTFDTAPNPEGVNNYWYRDQEGDYAEVTATGTLYGPFLTQPEERELPPANAPIAASGIEVRTSPSDGPTIDYTVPSGHVADEAGFYTWVWRIAYSEQSPVTQTVLPDQYEFQDRFGRVAETSITPTDLLISTQVVQTEAALGEAVADDVTVQLRHGGWLQADGARVPAVLTGTAYFSETLPELSDSPPESAERIGEVQITVSEPGTVQSEPLRMPLTAGFVTWQWCLDEAQQPESVRGMIKSTCDAYGQSSETIEVIAPSVITEATRFATVRDSLVDTAIVDGPIAEGVSLEFSLYRATTSEDDASSEPSCTAENLVTTTDRVPVEPGANEQRRYVSPEVEPQPLGTYWWVERLVHTDPETGTDTLLAEGICGLENETSTVKHPSVRTQAVAVAAPGEEVHDVAVVEGPLPRPESGTRTELTFEVFRDSGHGAICAPGDRVAALDTPIVIDEPGEYRSEAVALDTPGTYYWVETLAFVDEDGTREVVHVGECGLASETTTVVEALPRTGGTGAIAARPELAIVVGWVLASAVALVTLGVTRSRRR